MARNVYKLRDDLDQFRVILVTGPQRSGTTFMAKAFSHDMRRPFVDERVFGITNRNLWSHIIHEASHCIVQCPSMMRFVHDDVPADAFVVVMRRDVGDILSSQERIGWNDNSIELRNYGRSSGVISEIKYSHWDDHKHDGPDHWMEIEYESMSDHPLWVSKGQRRDFDAKQTEVR